MVDLVDRLSAHEPVVRWFESECVIGKKMILMKKMIYMIYINYMIYTSMIYLIYMICIVAYQRCEMLATDKPSFENHDGAKTTRYIGTPFPPSCGRIYQVYKNSKRVLCVFFLLAFSHFIPGDLGGGRPQQNLHALLQEQILTSVLQDLTQTNKTKRTKQKEKKLTEMKHTVHFAKTTE